MDTIADTPDIDIIMSSVITNITRLPFTKCTKLGEGANGAVYSIAPVDIESLPENEDISKESETSEECDEDDDDQD